MVDYSEGLKEFYGTLEVFGEEEAEFFLYNSFIPEKDIVIDHIKKELADNLKVSVGQHYGSPTPFIKVVVPSSDDLEEGIEKVIDSIGSVYGERFISIIAKYFGSEDWLDDWVSYSEDIFSVENPVNLELEYFANVFRSLMPQWKSLDDEGVFDNFDLKVYF